MFTAFLDESYNDDRYWLAGLVCKDALIPQIDVALDALAVQAHDEYGSEIDAEFHGHELFHGKGQWPLYRRARIAVYGQALEILGTFPVAILIRGVDIHRLKSRYTYPDHPHSVALAHLIERIDEYAEAALDGATVSMVADEVQDADEHQQSLWHFQAHATWGYRSRKIVHVEDLVFQPSHTQRLLQAIDLVSFLYQRRYARRGRHEKEDRTNDAIWSHVEPLVVHQHCWRP